MLGTAPRSGHTDSWGAARGGRRAQKWSVYVCGGEGVRSLLATIRDSQSPSTAGPGGWPCQGGVAALPHLACW